MKRPSSRSLAFAAVAALIVGAGGLFTATQVDAWGATGHRTIGVAAISPACTYCLTNVIPCPPGWNW